MNHYLVEQKKIVPAREEVAQRASRQAAAG